MSSSLKKSLNMDLPALAEMLRSKGRGKDTMLAHITPKEAALLKRKGGSGSVNPDTGLPEFEDSGDYSFEAPASVSPVTDTISTPADTSGGYGLNYGQAPTSTALPVTDASGQSYNYYPGAEQQSYATPGVSAGTQYGIQPAPPSLQPSLAQAPSTGITGTAPTTPSSTTSPSFGDKALTAITDPNNLARLGLAGALGIYGANQAKKAGKQADAAKAEEQAIAEPYKASGQNLIEQAQAGQLSAQSQQALAAARARNAQDMANRGGVGAQQAAAQEAALTAQLLDNQYKYGLNLMNIGDNISIGAIKQGLQSDQAVQQATTAFYTQLASIAAGGSIGGTTVRVG